MTERLQLDLETIPEAERARAADIEELANRLFAFADNVRDGVDLFDYCSAVTKHMLDERSQMIAEFKEKKETGYQAAAYSRKQSISPETIIMGNIGLRSSDNRAI